jgi:hypothetical protein
MLFEENLWNDRDNLRTTRFLVENDINNVGLIPVGVYRLDLHRLDGDGNRVELLKAADYVPFAGYTVEYIKFLLRHDREAVEAESTLRKANRKAEVEWGS